MFSINVVTRHHPTQAASGVIRIDDFTERFEISLSTWSLREYFDQWDSAKIALMAGSDKTAFVTSYFGQGEAVLLWWPVYRLKNFFAIQNHLLTHRAGVNIAKENLLSLVPDRELLTDENTPVSEWQCSIADMMTFAATRSIDDYYLH